MDKVRRRWQVFSKVLLICGVIAGLGGSGSVLAWFVLVEAPIRAEVRARTGVYLKEDPTDQNGKLGRIGFGWGLANLARHSLAITAGVVTFVLVGLGSTFREFGKVPRNDGRTLHGTAWASLAACWVVIGLVYLMGQ